MVGVGVGVGVGGVGVGDGGEGLGELVPPPVLMSWTVTLKGPGSVGSFAVEVTAAVIDAVPLAFPVKVHVSVCSPSAATETVQGSEPCDKVNCVEKPPKSTVTSPEEPPLFVNFKARLVEDVPVTVEAGFVTTVTVKEAGEVTERLAV